VWANYLLQTTQESGLVSTNVSALNFRRSFPEEEQFAIVGLGTGGSHLCGM